LVRCFVGLIGYNAVIKTLVNAVNTRIESTQDQAIDIEGAFGRRLHEIVKKYRGAAIKSEASDETYGVVHIPSDSISDEDVEQLNEEIKAEFQKFALIKGVVMQST